MTKIIWYKECDWGIILYGLWSDDIQITWSLTI